MRCSNCTSKNPYISSGSVVFDDKQLLTYIYWYCTSPSSMFLRTRVKDKECSYGYFKINLRI